MHPIALKYLSNDKNRHHGIIFIDIAEVDKIGSEMWHWSEYDVQGKKLVKAIIDSNFQE